MGFLNSHPHTTTPHPTPPPAKNKKPAVAPPPRPRLCRHTLRKPSRTSFIFSYLLKRSARDFSTEFRSARACSFSRASCCTVWWETDFSLCSSSGRRDRSQTTGPIQSELGLLRRNTSVSLERTHEPSLPEGSDETKLTDLTPQTSDHDGSWRESLTRPVRPLAHPPWRPRESTFPSLSRPTQGQEENITTVFAGRMRLKVPWWALGVTS